MMQFVSPSSSNVCARTTILTNVSKDNIHPSTQSSIPMVWKDGPPTPIWIYYYRIYSESVSCRLSYRIIKLLVSVCISLVLTDIQPSHPVWIQYTHDNNDSPTTTRHRQWRTWWGWWWWRCFHAASGYFVCSQIPLGQQGGGGQMDGLTELWIWQHTKWAPKQKRVLLVMLFASPYDNRDWCSKIYGPVGRMPTI